MVKFENPEVEVVKFHATDIVTTSVCTEDGCPEFTCDNDAGEW